MQKSLVLAMALAMGISATALAANPFSDVPAGHWAYGSIAKLAAAGIVDGYGDGTYRGDRLMTRYEMAQIVARAMAKGANVDRLASEFADELDSLGVRVAKLEKKSDNAKITGEGRFAYADSKTKVKDDADQHAYGSSIRSRVWVTGAVNDGWNYVTMLQNEQFLNNNYGDETTHFQRAYLEGRLGGTQAIIGRQNMFLMDGNLYDEVADAVNLTYGDKVKFNAFYGRPTNEDGDVDVTGGLGTKVDPDFYKKGEMDWNKFWGANVSADMGGFNLNAGYVKFQNSNATDDHNDAGLGLGDNGIWNVGAKYNFNDKASLGAIYMKSNLDGTYADGESTNGRGIVVTGTLMSADAEKAGSWGLWGRFYDQDKGTVVAHTMNGNYSKDGFKGWGAGLNYTVAKNMVAGLEYYDLDAKGTNSADRTIWSELVVTF
jgi:hypothetical protein